jgi:hypothetical protein
MNAAGAVNFFSIFLGGSLIALLVHPGWLADAN